MRPSKYKKSFNKLALEHFKKGKTISQLAAELMVSRETIYDWGRKFPEFSDTLCKGQDLAQAYWENLQHGKSVGAEKTEKFSERGIEFNLKTRFRRDYAEKIEVDQDNKINITYKDA
jgi:hypothetical protein